MSVHACMCVNIYTNVQSPIVSVKINKIICNFNISSF